MLSIKQIVIPLLSAGCMMILLSTCTKDPDELLESITEGVILNVNTDIFRVPVSVQFLNANTESANSPENLQVSVEGKDRNLVYSTSGSKDLEAVNGILEIAVDRELVLNKQNPIELRVVAEAPGYLKTIRNLYINDTTFQAIPVRMAALQDLPEGSTAVETVFDTDEEGLEEDVEFATAAAPEKEETGAVSMEKGTKMLDENDNELTGKIEAQLVHFDNRSEESLSAFPGGLVAPAVIDQNGQNLGTTEFITAGFVSLDMFIGGEEIKTFSDPIEMRIGVDPNMMHPETGQKLRVGDEIPVWSLNEKTGQWEYESTSVIGANMQGKMEAVFEMTHLSWWNVAFANNNTCSESDPVTFSIQSNFSGECTTPNYFVELVHTAFMMAVGDGQYVRIEDGGTFEITNIPADEEYQLIFYDLADVSCRQAIITVSLPSAVSCDQTYSLDLTGLNQSLFTIEATMSGICEGTSSDVLIKPDFVVYFRPAGCSSWNFLNNAEQGFFCSSNLERGGAYDFKVNYGTEEYLFEGVTMESQTINFNNSTLQIVINSDSNASLNFQDIVLPDDFCDEILGG